MVPNVVGQEEEATALCGLSLAPFDDPEVELTGLNCSG